MPSGISVTLLLLFFLFYLPMVSFKWGFNRIIPLRQAELHLSEEVFFIHAPVVVIVLVVMWIFSIFGKYLDVDIILVAMGNTTLINRKLFDAIKEKTHIYLFFEIIAVGLTAGAGLLSGRYRLQNLRSQKKGEPSLFGRSLDPWFCLFLKEKNEQIMIDVLTKSSRLYSGELQDYHRSKDGELTGLLLKGVTRYKQLETINQQGKDYEIIPIPGKCVHFFASDLANVNLRILRRGEAGETYVSYDFDIEKEMKREEAKEQLVQNINAQIRDLTRFDYSLAANLLKQRTKILEDPNATPQQKEQARLLIQREINGIVSRSLIVPDEVVQKINLPGNRLGSIDDVKFFIEELEKERFPQRPS